MPTRTPKASAPVEVADDKQELEADKVETPATYTVTYISEGREYQVEVMDINGRKIVATSVYKEVPLPYSKRTTKILVAAAGTQLRV